MHYQYTAKAASGQTKTGIVDAVSQTAARQQLRQQGLFALSLTDRASTPVRSSSRRGRRDRSRVTKTDLLMLTSQLTIMCRSGIDLAEALRNVAEQCTKPALKRALQAVYQDVADGEPVSVALKNQSHIFGEAYTASIAAGEASGNITDVLARLADLLRNEIRLRTTLKTVLTYPIVLISVAGVVIASLIFFVLPQFAKVFEDLEAPAPPLTQMLLDSAQTLRENAWVLAALTCALAFAVFRLWGSPAARRYRDGLLLNGVVIRAATRALLTGRTFRLLGTMLASGIPLMDAIKLARSAVKNVYFRDLFDALEEDVLNGRGVAAALAGAEFVPMGATQMVMAAEQTGKLGPVMQSVGEFYEDEGERLVRELANFLEPAIIVIMGLIVAVVVLSVMLPLLDFSTLSS